VFKTQVISPFDYTTGRSVGKSSGTTVLHTKVVYRSIFMLIPSFSRLYAHEVHLKEAIFRLKAMPNN